MKNIRTLLISGMVLVLTMISLTIDTMAAPPVRQSIYNAEVYIEEPYFTENHEPKLYVSYEDIPLVRNIDYTVKYNYSPQTNKVICFIHGINNYCYLKLEDFEIEYPGFEIARFASSSEFIGIPYVWGGTSKNGFDCSGFVQYVFKCYDISLNRIASDQAKQGTKVHSRDELLPGDLVFFNDYGHVGIYIGNDKFVHASNSGIKITSLYEDATDGSYYETRYCGATRIF